MTDDKCTLCGGMGEWYGNDGQYGPIECEPCPVPDPRYNAKGWLIVDWPGECGAENDSAARVAQENTTTIEAITLLEKRVKELEAEISALKR